MTAIGQLDGVVMTFFDIAECRQAEEYLLPGKASREQVAVRQTFVIAVALICIKSLSIRRFSVERRNDYGK